MFRGKDIDELSERFTRLEDNYLTNIPRVATLEARFNAFERRMQFVEGKLDGAQAPDSQPGEALLVNSLTAAQAEGAPLWQEDQPAQPARLPEPSLPNVQDPATSLARLNLLEKGAAARYLVSSHR